jgi:hypothetical protein
MVKVYVPGATEPLELKVILQLLPLPMQPLALKPAAAGEMLVTWISSRVLNGVALFDRPLLKLSELMAMLSVTFGPFAPITATAGPLSWISASLGLLLPLVQALNIAVSPININSKILFITSLKIFNTRTVFYLVK